MEGGGKITRRQDLAISTEPAVVYWTTLSHHLSGQTDRNNLKSQSRKPVGLENGGGGGESSKKGVGSFIAPSTGQVHTMITFRKLPLVLHEAHQKMKLMGVELLYVNVRQSDKPVNDVLCKNIRMTYFNETIQKDAVHL